MSWPAGQGGPGAPPGGPPGPGGLTFTNIVNAILSLLNPLNKIANNVTTITVLTSAQPYDMAVNFQGVPTASQTFRYTATRPISFGANFGTINGGMSEASASIAATGSTVFTIDKAPAATPNTFSNIGSITFSAASVIGAFTSVTSLAYSLTIGDVLRIVCPASPDATLSGISITLAGAR